MSRNSKMPANGDGSSTSEIKYELLDRISIGGMAEVFQAKAVGIGGFQKQVAIKRILPHFSEDSAFVSMFVNEAKLAAQLSHANIAQIYDLGRLGDSYFISMELVQGKDLRSVFDRLCRRDEIMPIAGACHLLMHVCEGLDYAHNKKDSSGRALSIVHRDVSPQNILISYDGEIKLIDFGVAKASTISSKTEAGTLKGKFCYMSPEQVRGLPVDRRSDIFSVGIILYELITGDRLFLADNPTSTLELVRNARIQPPSHCNRNVPRKLDRIVLKALSKDPDDRYDNARDMAEALHDFMSQNGKIFTRRDLGSLVRTLFPENAPNGNAVQTAPPEPPSHTLVQIQDPGAPYEELNTVEASAPKNGPLQKAIEEGVKKALETECAGKNARSSAVSLKSNENAKPISDRSTFKPPEYMSYSKLQSFVAGLVRGPAFSINRRRLSAAIALVSLVFVCAHFISLGYAQPESATLYLNIQPRDSAVVFDGKAIGQGQSFLVVVAKPGRHLLTVMRDGYNPDASVFEAVPGIETRRIISLEEKNRIYGSLVVDSVPAGAVVSINGRVLAHSTPVRVDHLLAEIDHPLLIEKTGLRPIETTVRIGKDEEKHLKVLFEDFNPGQLEGGSQTR